MAGRKLQKYLEPAAATFSATGPTSRYEDIGRLQHRTMLSGGGLRGSNKKKPSIATPRGLIYPESNVAL